MKHPFKIITFTLAALVMLAYATHAYARSKDVPSLVSVSLPRGGGIVDIQIDNFENPRKNGGNKTLLAVHGLAHTGATFKPLAKELFKKTGRDKIDRVLALNFPGRNGSGLPSNPNLPFGNLTVEDYTAVLLGVLDQLPKQINIESIVGHSMGGLIIQTAQNSLRSSGTSLQKEYGIKNVYLLAPSIPIAPSIPNPLPWLFADSGAASAIAADLLSSDPILGAYLQLLSNDPDDQAERLEIWLRIFFTDRLAEFGENALELDYVSNEALIVTLQLLGFPGFVRPSVNPGIFNKSVQKCFRLITFSEDLRVADEDLLEEYQDLGTFLTGNAPSANVVLIDAPDAVHDMFIVNPTEVAKAITSCP